MSRATRRPAAMAPDPQPVPEADAEQAPLTQQGPEPEPEQAPHPEQAPDPEQAPEQATDLAADPDEVEAVGSAATQQDEATEPDPPVYDERGNVRPHGTPGARPMTFQERVAIAAELRAEQG